MKAFVALVLVGLTVGTTRAAAASLEEQLEATGRLLQTADSALRDGDSAQAIQLYGATITAYEEIARRFPDQQSPIIQFRTGYCRSQLMRLLREQRLGKAGMKEPGDAAAPKKEPPPMNDQVRKVIVLCRMGQFEQAEQLADAYVAHAPNDALGHLALATTYVGLGRNVAAIDALRKSLDIDDTLGDAHYNLAQLLLRQLEPDFDEARKHYLRAVALGIPRDEAIEVVLDTE